MAVRPRRKDPISTRPVYLPKVPAKELQEVAKARTSAAAPGLRIYTDGAPGDPDIEKLAQLVAQAEAGAAVVGELLSELAGRPHREVRDTVAALAHGLAWARIRDPAKQDYRVLPLRGEIDQEEARFRARSLPEYPGLQAPSPPVAAMYDASRVQAAYREVLPQGRDDGGSTYIVITGRRLGRWDAKAGRWTPLAVLPGPPVLVSVSGLEGSAEPNSLVAEIRGALSRR
ncbi:MAG: hypothetical protein A2148_09645 [Chloroflexi bacterium RBG_16_68_14]|nr:MAG: hypothetical protein A2148_09645 [Chloroflexi bacterium RBG_16_68_14]